MKRSAFALAFISALLFSAVAGTQSVSLVSANATLVSSLPQTPDTSLPKITIQLPEDNESYGTNEVAYSIIVEKPSSWFDYDTISGQLFSVVYYLDNGEKVTLATLSSIEEYDNKQPSTFKGTLSGLSDGNHSLEVVVHGVSYYVSYYQDPNYPSYYYLNNSLAIYFRTDTTSPSISNLSIANKTVGTKEILLNFELNEPTSNITYCLDNTANITIAGNTTLSGLTIGTHNLTVYAWDAVGNIGVSQTIDFEVTQQTEPAPFPTVPFLTVTVALVFVVVAGLLVYFKKRNRGVEPS